MLKLFCSLRFRLLLLVSFSLVPVAVMVLNRAADERTNARRMIAEQAQLVTRVASMEYSLYLDSRSRMFESLAQDTLAHRNDPNACARTLAERLQHHTAYTNIVALNGDGSVLCSAAPVSGTLILPDRDLMQRTMSGRTIVSGNFQTDAQGRPILPVGFPIVDTFDNAHGAIFVATDMKALGSNLSAPQLPDDAVFTLLDHQGRVVIHIPHSEHWIGQTLQDDRLLDAARDQVSTAVEAIDPDGVLRLSGIHPLGGSRTKASVVVGIPTESAYAEANVRLLLSLLSFGFVSMIALAAVWLGGEALVVRRIRTLIDTTRRLAAGNLSARSGLASDDGELGELSRAVDSMAQALEYRDAQLSHQAFTDPVTNLPNRTWFLGRLRLAIDLASRSGNPLAVLFIDLDNFKVVNDSLGHVTGDRLLAEIGGRLARALGPDDLIARFGGDEFIVLVKHLSEPATIRRLAERLLAELSRPAMIDQREIIVTASAGVVIGTTLDSDPDTLLRHVDIAMYRAKASGKNRAVLFDAEMQRSVIQRLEMETDLRQALDRDELEIWYQPEVDLRSGRIAGVEALLRWRHPIHGLIPPSAFIPLAEETGLIIPIGRWLLFTACKQMKEWHQTFPNDPPLMLSVNLSAHQFAEPDLVTDVQRALAQSGLDAASLWLEITESVLMEDAATAVTTLQAIGEVGVRFALDDFGTGYSSLNYLRQFPFHMLKIDKSFTDDLGDPGSRAIVQSVTSLAHALNKQVTVEGIETTDQLEQIGEFGCDWGQGYLFARPLPPEELIRLFADHMVGEQPCHSDGHATPPEVAHVAASSPTTAVG